MVITYVIGIGVALLVLWMLIWASSEIIAWILKPLDIPKEFEIERKRERFLRRLALLGLSFSYYGAIVLVPTYLFGWLRHRRMNAAALRSGRLGIIPQFTLADLMTLVFSLALFPIIMGITMGIPLTETEMASLFAGAAVGFPACFICGLYRTEIHRIPRGFQRTCFLFMTPYLFEAPGFVLLYPIAFFWPRFYYQSPPFLAAFSAAILFSSRGVAGMVRSLANESGASNSNDAESAIASEPADVATETTPVTTPD